MHHWGTWPSQSVQLELNYFIPQHLENIIIESRYQIKIIIESRCQIEIIIESRYQIEIIIESRYQIEESRYQIIAYYNNALHW